jgi:AcrR family transcriptional regulator
VPPKQKFTSVWTRDAARGRTGREQQGLSRPQIVRAAVELLDAEGLDALSMRRLGARLGVGATSIYWHVATKDDLVELAMDDIIGEVADSLEALDEERGSWREVATTCAYGMRDMLFRHPWMARLLGLRPFIGPNALRMSARILAVFRRAGFEGRDVDFAVSAVMSYTLGATVPAVALQIAVEREDLQVEEMMAVVRSRLHEARSENPELARMYDDYADADMRSVQAMSFDYGLVCVLDGLAARLPEPAPRRDPARSDTM